MTRWWEWLGAGALLLAACKSTTEGPTVPAGIAVAVEVAGSVRTIDTAKLSTVKPDYADRGRRAWRLGTLLPAMGSAAKIDVVNEAGVKQRLPKPRTDQVVVLAVNRAGSVRVGVVSKKKPFPPFHGRGGNRGRQGDPARVKNVKRIIIQP